MALRNAITEKIVGLSRKPLPCSHKWNSNVEREYHPPLHLPPFWWSERAGPSWPWQCWSLDDYAFKNCKWEGCYRECSCRQKEEEITIKCRFPGHCGYHIQLKKNNENFPERKKLDEMNKLCCYCNLENSESKSITGNGEIPDPRCLGQYHSSLLENILGRGTTVEIGKTKCSPRKGGRSIRGYIPGDVHGFKGWSECVGGDPMREELNNSFFPFENASTESKLSRLSGNQTTTGRSPCYEHYCQDHRYQYGIQPEQLYNRIQC